MILKLKALLLKKFMHLYMLLRLKMRIRSIEKTKLESIMVSDIETLEDYLLSCDPMRLREEE